MISLCQQRQKCDFNVEKISILEVVVEQGDIQMKNNKIKVVKE